MKLPYIASALRRNVTAASHDATACCAALQARKRDTMSLAVPQSVQKILVLTTRENTMVAHTPKARRGHTPKARHTFQCDRFAIRRPLSDLERSQVALHANGKIRWWNFKLGRLIDTHNARHKTDALLTTGTTDTTNSFMVTADSLGYLKVWDISQYSEATGQQTHFIQLYVCARLATA